MRKRLARHDPPPPRRPTNVSLDSSLLGEAKRLGVNISRACEQGLAEQIAKVRAELWLEENREALASSNRFAESQGLPLSPYRQF